MLCITYVPLVADGVCDDKVLKKQVLGNKHMTQIT